jgi:hypothetical protein
MPRYSSIRRDQEGSATRVWQEGYDEGYAAGFRLGYETGSGRPMSKQSARLFPARDIDSGERLRKKRKPSAWNKFVKANSKKPRFKYRNGKLNLKKMAVAFRKTPAGKKKRR